MKAELLRNIEDLQECLRRVGVEVAKLEVDGELSEDCCEYCVYNITGIGSLIIRLKREIQSENKNGK